MNVHDMNIHLKCCCQNCQMDAPAPKTQEQGLLDPVRILPLIVFMTVSSSMCG